MQNNPKRSVIPDFAATAERYFKAQIFLADVYVKFFHKPRQ
jgi:hypothetical protein